MQNIETINITLLHVSMCPFSITVESCSTVSVTASCSHPKKLRKGAAIGQNKQIAVLWQAVVLLLVIKGTAVWTYSQMYI